MNLILPSFVLLSSASRKSDAFPTHHQNHCRCINPSTITPLLSNSFHNGDSDISKNGINMRGLTVRGGGGDDDDISSALEKMRAFVSKNFFLLGMFVAVSFAKLFPEVRLLE